LGAKISFYSLTSEFRLSNPDKTKDWAAMVPVTPQILGVSGQQGLRISIAQIA
jgi:hypothetical protein